MIDNETTPLTLSREDLYELAWSKPTSELAKDFGISDVALAKRCRRLGIPVPGRGYWARVDAGQTPYRPKLPKREPKWGDQEALTVAPSQRAPFHALAALAGADGSLQSVKESWTTARIEALAIAPTYSILEALAPVKRTAVKLKHSPRSQLTFQRGERTGPVVAIEVTQNALDRALLLADTVLRAASDLGWMFAAPPVPPQKQKERDERDSPSNEEQNPETQAGRLIVDGEQVAFRIEERFRSEPYQPTASELAREKRESSYHAPRKMAVATGNLRVVRVDTYRTYGRPDRQSWFDHKGRRVEDQIKEILLGFYELALSIKERRAKDEADERERQEEERRRKEWEAHQEANQRLIKQLETDAGAWHRARYLRRYIQAARKGLGARSLRARFETRQSTFSSGRRVTLINWTHCTTLSAQVNLRKVLDITFRTPSIGS
jgi:hypothetical protein